MRLAWIWSAKNLPLAATVLAQSEPRACRSTVAPVRRLVAGRAGSVRCRRPIVWRCQVDEFLTDIETLRRRAREHLEEGPITAAYGADRGRVIDVLNTVLATELVCVLRYKRHYYTATGLRAAPAAAEFLEHASDEQAHVDEVAMRIVQLQGSPDFDPEGLATRSHAEYDDSTALAEMIEEDLVAELLAIQSYQEIARWLGDKDSTTRTMIERILAVEEEHADDLLGLLHEFG